MVLHGRTKRRWEDSMKMELIGFGWGGHGLDWSNSGWGQLLGSCDCGDEPPGSIKREEFLDQLRNG
jgi:hypothetical protein